MNLRISVSRIDEFRRVCTTDWATESMLINSIREPTVLGWQARFGEALHSCIEDPAKYRQTDGSYAVTERDGKTYRWPGAVVDPCVEAWPKGCVFERRCEKDYRIGAHNVLVSGRTDAVHGLVIVEGKTKFGYLDLNDYVSSLQWQFYLVMSPWARGVEYRIHEIGGMYDRDGEVTYSGPSWSCLCETPTGQLRKRKVEPKVGSCEDCGSTFAYRPGGPGLEDIHEFRMWRTPSIAGNCRRWAEEFVAWADKRELLPFLVNKWA